MTPGLVSEDPSIQVLLRLGGGILARIWPNLGRIIKMEIIHEVGKTASCIYICSHTYQLCWAYIHRQLPNVDLGWQIELNR